MSKLDIFLKCVILLVLMMFVCLSWVLTFCVLLLFLETTDSTEIDTDKEKYMLNDRGK